MITVALYLAAKIETEATISKIQRRGIGMTLSIVGSRERDAKLLSRSREEYHIIPITSQSHHYYRSYSSQKENVPCPNTLSLHLAYTDLPPSLRLILIRNAKEKLNFGISRATSVV